MKNFNGKTLEEYKIYAKQRRARSEIFSVFDHKRKMACMKIINILN